jgi:RNA polymerase sigma-70 factor, ECF subfamily
MSRDGVPVAITTIEASAQGIDQLMWFLRLSKLAAISLAGQKLSDSYRAGQEAA